MARTLASPGETIRKAWAQTSRLPAGRRIFSFVLGWIVPYTGSISPYVEELRPGYARVRIQERRGLRNHLRSVHAVALMNLVEVTSGLAMTTGLPATTRGIVTGLDIQFHKKARGILIGESTVALPEKPVTETTEMLLECQIRDRVGDVVATGHARWRLAPVPTETA